VRPGTPAAEAGLQSGDTITAVDGDAITSGDELTTTIGSKKPGDSVSVTYTRDGTSHTVEVQLATRPA
jgi:putative serine protease PepD